MTRTTLDEDGFYRHYGAVERPTPQGRPWLLANMVASVDGSAAVDGRVGALSSGLDQRLFAYLRGMADAVLVGAETARAEHYGPLVRNSRLVIVTRSGDLDFGARLFAESAHPVLVATPTGAANETRQRAAGRAQVLGLGDDGVDLPALLADLRRRGMRTIVTEGGPAVLTQLAAQSLLDELCLTISAALGGDDLRILRPGLGGVRRLRLVHALQDGDDLYLRYLT